MACRSLRWSTVICRISAFSSLDEPCRENEQHFTRLHQILRSWLITEIEWFELSLVTCFSKALGTSLLSSDRLWLIRSLRLFSMIYTTWGAGRQSGPTKTTGPKRQKKIQGYNPLTPLLFFRARICEALPGDMDPVTGLYHGDRERVRERWGRCGGGGGIGTERDMVTLILLHIVIITLLNMTQRQDGTSAPFNLICFLGTEQHRSARERREDEIVFGLMRFWTLVSVKWHAVLLSIWAKALLERWLYSLGAMLSLAWGSNMQHGIWAPPSTVTQYGLCLFVNSRLTGLKEPDSLEFPSNCPTRDLLSFY